MFVLFIIPVVIAIVIVAAVVVVRKEKHQKDAQQRATTDSYASRSSTNASTGKTAMTDEQRRKLEYLRQQQKAKTPQVDKHELHVQDAKEHAHTGEEEHYEEIVGSLGEINDEGCVDLSGVRFIVHDLAYETGDEGEHDYTELAKAMVLGDIINTPRFKGLRRP